MEVAVYVTERFGREVMRPANDEVGTKCRDLLTARHIGRSDERQASIGGDKLFRLFAVGRDRAGDLVSQSQRQQKLRRTRIGDEHALRHMIEKELRPAPFAIRRKEALTRPLFRRTAAAPLGEGEPQHEHRKAYERHERYHTA